MPMGFKRSVYAAALMSLGMGLGTSLSRAEQNVPAQPALAPIQTAHTFAQLHRGEKIATLLVVGLSTDSIRAIDLSAINEHYSPDAFDVVSSYSAVELDGFASRTERIESYPVDQLIGVGPRGVAHIAAGTNYPEHGKETGMDEGAFLFPKLSPAGSPRAQVATAPGVLLDYEVEVCARFDREVRSLADFDAARKGLFLCGDFSDRATLFRNINLGNPYSGDGFADAKSGSDRFPTGPFLVVPRDWKQFLQSLTIRTYVDDSLRQNANAGDMIKDLRGIVEEALAEAGTRTWSYRNGRIVMLKRTAIGTDSAILTGTAEGVVFQEPSPELVKEITAAKDRAQQLAIIDRYIAEEGAKRIYLQPGGRVRHESNYLGWIDAKVVAASAAGE
jgi:2-keto-4-pentenoate hydratase/2-oxohepta-3-ene-1,7-dioic acid hydratase in catechol pathway